MSVLFHLFFYKHFSYGALFEESVLNQTKPRLISIQCFTIAGIPSAVYLIDVSLKTRKGRVWKSRNFDAAFVQFIFSIFMFGLSKARQHLKERSHIT